MEPSAALAGDDDRLTTAGLFLEVAGAVHATLERHLRDECGLTLASFELLVRLARAPDARLRMCDLAAQVAMSPSGLTRAVDRLADAGLVAREQCVEDRRVAWARLTPEGLARLEGAVPRHLEHLDAVLFAALDHRDRERLAGMLRAVRDHLDPPPGWHGSGGRRA